MSDKIKVREPGEGLRRRKPTMETSNRVSLLNEENRSEICYILCDKIIPYHNQPRLHFDEEEIQSLASTIKTHGVRQPLTVIESFKTPGFFEVVSGERRLRAAKVAGLRKVPCLIIHDHSQAEELAVIENVQRKDLHPIELGNAYLRLVESGICTTQQEVANKIGVPRTHVVEMMKLATLPDSLKKLLIKNNITQRAFFRDFLKNNKNDPASIEAMEKKLKNMLELDISKKGDSTSSFLKKRKKISVINISFNEGELKVDKKGLSLCPKSALPQVKEELEQLLTTILAEGIEDPHSAKK